MAPKKPTKQTRLQTKAAQANKVMTGPKGSKPQSTTNKQLFRQGDKLTMSGPKRGGGVSKPAAPSKPIGTGKGGVSKPAGGSSGPTKADAKSWQKMNQSASARAGKAAEPKMTPRTPAPGTGNVVRTAIEYGQKTKEAQRQATRAAKMAKGNYGKLAGTMAKGAGRAVLSAIRKNPVVATAAAASAPRALGDGTLTAAMKRGDYKPNKFENARAIAFKKAAAIKGSPVVGPKKSAAGQFDSAFAAARKAGKSTFTWKGKKYTTKMK